MQLKIGDAAFISIRAEYDVEKSQFEFDLNGTTSFFTYDAEAKKFNLYQVDGYDVDFTKSSNFNTPVEIQGNWANTQGTSVIIKESSIYIVIENGEQIKITEATVTAENGIYHVSFQIGTDTYDIEYGTYGETTMVMQNLTAETFYYLTKVTE